MPKKTSKPKTPTDPLKHPAVRTLRAFIAAMNEWERRLIAADFKSMADFNKRGAAMYSNGLREIYERFCEPGAAPNRLTELNWEWQEPDYNPKTERIVSVKVGGNKITIDTQMSRNYDFRMRYELLRVGNEWRLREERKCFDPDVRKWCPCEL